MVSNLVYIHAHLHNSIYPGPDVSFYPYLSKCGWLLNQYNPITVCEMLPNIIILLQLVDKNAFSWLLQYQNVLLNLANATFSFGILAHSYGLFLYAKVK